MKNKFARNTQNILENMTCHICHFFTRKEKKKKKNFSVRNEIIPDFTILGRRFWAIDMAIASSTFK